MRVLERDGILNNEAECGSISNISDPKQLTSDDDSKQECAKRDDATSYCQNLTKNEKAMDEVINEHNERILRKYSKQS